VKNANGYAYVSNTTILMDISVKGWKLHVLEYDSKRQQGGIESNAFCGLEFASSGKLKVK